MSVTDDLLENARQYAASFDKGDLPLPPAKHVAVVACMDARLNPYGLLGFDHEPLRALRARNSQRVIYLGSFSKTFSPGLRVGWVLAPLAVREKLVLATEAQVLCPPSLTQYAVARYLDTQPWREQIKLFTELYR